MKKIHSYARILVRFAAVAARRLAAVAAVAVLVATGTASAQAAAIYDVGKKSAKVKLSAAPELKVGTSVLIYRADGAIASVITRAKVSAINAAEGAAELEFMGFSDLAQKALPKASLTPRDGDEIIARYLYDKGILIAFSEEEYLAAARVLAAQQISLLPPELLAQNLAEDGAAMPSAKLLREFCAEWALGAVFLADAPYIKGYDCATFARFAEYEFAGGGAGGAGGGGTDGVGGVGAGGDLPASPDAPHKPGRKGGVSAKFKGINFYSALAKQITAKKSSKEQFKELLE